jgi:hypothetical protein
MCHSKSYIYIYIYIYIYMIHHYILSKIYMFYLEIIYIGTRAPSQANSISFNTKMNGHTLFEDSGAANTCLTHANNFF